MPLNKKVLRKPARPPRTTHALRNLRLEGPDTPSKRRVGRFQRKR